MRNLGGSLIINPMSQYEGEKWTDLQSQRIAEGDLKAKIEKFGRRAPVTSYLCERCLTHQRTSVITRVRVQLHGRVGKRVKGRPGFYVQTCEDCAGYMRRQVT